MIFIWPLDDAESDTRSEAGTVSQSASSTSLSTMSSGTSRTSKKKQSSRKLGAQDMHVDDIDKMKVRIISGWDWVGSYGMGISKPISSSH